MPAALIIYCVFLLIEGGLALLMTGNAFLLAASTCGVLFYAAVWKSGGAWGEVCRALFAGLIAVAGPLYYKGAMIPTMLCFIALPHLLAATQSFWEIALRNDPASQNAKMRTVIFTVAFYMAMGLVLVLLRGLEPYLPVWISAPLGVLVLLMALPAWDMARVTRLKPGRAPRSPRTLILGRLMLLGAVLGAVAVLFAGVLPAASEKLCEVSPRWRAKAESPEKAPPHQPQPPPPSNGEANRPGMDSSAMTGRHELPRQSDIRSTGSVELYVKMDRDQADGLAAAGHLYVRSHTFDKWEEGVWTASSTAGRWIEDAADGSQDGMTEVRQNSRPVYAYSVFLNNADGFSLPALQGVTAYGLPKVFGLPGDLYQIQASGSIRYEARSAPLVWDTLPNRDLLRIGKTGNPSHTRNSGGRALSDLVFRDRKLFPDKSAPLAVRVAGIRDWFAANVQYSTVMEGHPSLTPLDNFLQAERKGYCDFYATAACLILRLSDIPTRIAYGYASDQYDPAEGVWTFTDETAHAWTEIYLDGLGWTVCDFTPPSNVGNLDSKEDKPKREPLDEKAYEGPQQPKPEPPSSPEPETFSLSAWWKDVLEKAAAMNAADKLLLSVKVLGAVVVVMLLFRWLFKKRKQARKPQDTFGEDEKQPAYFSEFLRLFREAGYPRPSGATPREYFDYLLARGAAGRELSPMIAYHYGRRYADGEADKKQEDEWLSLVRDSVRRLQEVNQHA